ncbi:MAG: S41 family peptidase, partial [Bryobacter sp.]|nr:S41 family peptidase [Bryobacter sp.]
SASEIVAACLQDHERARIIGQRSWGKGTVQNVIQIEAGRAALKLTTASYWRPSGKNIHRLKEATDEDEWGVRPDPGFEVTLTDEQADGIRRRRRDKDIGAASKPAPEAAANKDASEPAEPAGDPQLQKALEYLQPQLGPAKS